MTRYWRLAAWSALSAGFLFSRASRADDAAAPLPDSLLKQDQASSGATNVATSGFEKADKPAADAKDASELSLSAGGLASAGNSRSIAATSAGKFRVRRGANQLGAAVAANFARSAAKKDDALETTVENFQGKLRYDRFLAGSFAVFGAASARHDKFQGLDLRLNFDPGIEYYVVDEGKEQLWTEIGYDLQYDIRTDDELATAAATGAPLAKRETRHSARGFAGYTNHVNAAVTMATGLEYLQGLDDSRNYRLNWDGSVSSTVGKGFSIATTVSVRYDHNPLPEVEKTDVVTSLSLVYQLL
jgi:putative salt-induced outer membrane protein